MLVGRASALRAHPTRDLPERLPDKQRRSPSGPSPSVAGGASLFHGWTISLPG
jgi:hypothetical protein